MVFPYAVLIICFLLGAFLLFRWFTTAQPSAVVGVIRWVLLILGGFAVLAFLFFRQFGLLAMALFFFLPFLMNFSALRNRIKAARGASPGGTSEVETRFLKMALDHDTGEIDGEVLEGTFVGRLLSELSPEELVALWQECRAEDGQSAGVLEAYLDRVHGSAWRQAAGADPADEGAAEDGAPGGGASGRRSRWGGGGSQASGGMSENEALDVLGLSRGATREEINEAHRRLMQTAHPDHGGSNYLAAKINEAKDLLLALAR